jgi:hypothetical protein
MRVAMRFWGKLCFFSIGMRVSGKPTDARAVRNALEFAKMEQSMPSPFRTCHKLLEQILIKAEIFMNELTFRAIKGIYVD